MKNRTQTRVNPANVLLIACALLIAIWPLPETMVVRNLILLTGLVSSVMVIYQVQEVFTSKLAWPIWILLTFFGWIVFHLLFLSRNFEEQFYDLWGDWLRSFVAACMGAALGAVLNDDSHIKDRYDGPTREIILIAGLSGSLLIYLIRYAYEVISTNQWLHLAFYEHPFREKPAIVVFASILLPAVLVKSAHIFQGKAHKGWLHVAYVVILALVFSFYTANTKNGFLALAATLALFTVGIVWRRRWLPTRTNMVTLLACAIALIATLYVAKLHVDLNPAWKTLFVDMQTAADIEANQTWKNREVHKMPLNHNGVEVNGSTYDRTAWAVVALTLIRENPMGYGLINHSFGALAREKWPDFYPPQGKNRGATHSGWIDLTLGIGIPGLLLLWIPLLTATRRAVHQTGFWFQYIVLTTPVLMFIYMITEVSTGHYIEFLLFFVALACGLTLKSIPVARTR